MEVTQFVEKYGVERKDTASLKWDALAERFGDPNLIPLWVADMEFKVPEEVRKAMHERIDHGVFGYSKAPDSYYNAFINWQKTRHNIHIEREWIRFTPGIVSLLYWAVVSFTEELDAIIIQSPVYYPFHNAVKDNNRKLIRSELKHDENGRYFMDLVDFEEKIKKEKVKMFILCSPHNPIGRIWTEEELTKVLEICQKYNVLVISDEIHQDITLGNRKFISSLNIANGAYHKNLIVCSAPSKTFNMAGLLNSNIIIPDTDTRNLYDMKIKKLNQVELSVMGQIACEAAYNHGEEWLDGLLKTVEFNFNYLKENFEKNAPKAIVTELEGTYLTWIDLRPYVSNDDIKEFIQDKCGLAIDFGEWFSDGCKGFIRINLATEPKYVKLAVENILSEIKKLN